LAEGSFPNFSYHGGDGIELEEKKGVLGVDTTHDKSLIYS
jgi:hypothetical protein